MTGSVVLVM